LIDAGRLSGTAHFPETQNWETLLQQVDWLRTADHKYGTLVIDTANGLERLLHEHVCHRDYNDDWGDRGFGAYQKGYEVSLADLNSLLSTLDSIRIEKRMVVVLLMHRKIITVKNPAGADYDMYSPDLHKTTWGAISKWLDTILYGDWEVIVGQQVENKKTGNKKGKGIAQSRLLRTEGSPAWVAKNRLGLVPEIECGDSAEEAFANFTAALKAARNPQPTEPPTGEVAA